MPTIDVIIPVYNAGLLLNRCVDSLLNQTDKIGYNIILVDDGSQDDSGRICDEYEKRFSNIKVFHKENGGCIDARRYGLENSNGEYIVFADSDDFVEIDYIENIKKAIVHPADYYILNNQRNFITHKGYYIEKNFLIEGYVGIETVYEWFLGAINGAVWDKIYVRSIINKYNIKFTENITHGEDFYINIMYLQRVKITYCQNTASYVHMMDTVTSVCRYDASIKRLDDLQFLYKTVLEKIPVNTSRNMVEVYARSVVSSYFVTIGLMVNSDSNMDGLGKRYEKCLYPLELCQAKTFKEKIYDWILLKKHYQLAGYICRINQSKIYHYWKDWRYTRRKMIKSNINM